MKALATLVIFAACHPADVQHRGAAPLPALTGANHEDVLDRMTAAQRLALAYELVRAGNLTCPRVNDHCGMTSIDPPRDDEGLDAPCLRRSVVQWVLRRAGRITMPADVLALLAKQDAELVEAVADTLDDNVLVDWLVAVEAAGTTSPYGILLERPREVVLDAARRHVDTAIPELSRVDDRDAVIAAIADPQIAPQTRADLLIGLDLPPSPALIAALESAAAERHCMLSAHAAETLAELGRKEMLPRPPRTRDPSAYFHQACRLTAGMFYGMTLSPPFAPKSGLVLVAPEGEPFADTRTPSRRTVTDEVDLVLLLRDLSNATCDAKTCRGSAARYDLVWSKNVLARVTVHRDFAQEDRERAAADACDPGIGGD